MYNDENPRIQLSEEDKFSVLCKLSSIMKDQTGVYPNTLKDMLWEEYTRLQSLGVFPGHKKD